MSVASPLYPSAFVLDGGSVGLLLVHGFTGSPTEIRRIAPALQEHGLTVSAPLLPGHGTTPADLNRQRLEDWLDHVRASLSDLQRTCPTVFIGGLSLGALLALHVAAERPHLAGVVVYSPPILITDRRSSLVPLIKHLIRELPKPPDHFTDPTAAAQLWNYPTYPVAATHHVLRLTSQVKQRLPRVTCPALVVASRIDRSLHPHSAQYTYDHLGAREKELVQLENSGHVITLDSQWQRVADETIRFITAHTPPGALRHASTAKY
jgi:carboxylesterase